MELSAIGQLIVEATQRVQWVSLLLLALVAFIQNMAFTMTGRSRAAGDPSFHRYCSWGSNGIWFLCFMFLFKLIWEPIQQGDWLFVALAGVIYTAVTAEGSVLMMKIMLKKEKGKRRVGARG
jgi:Na+-driven multidrug efflux pump